MLAGVRYALADPVIAQRARGREAFIRACMYVTIALYAYRHRPARAKLTVAGPGVATWPQQVARPALLWRARPRHARADILSHLREAACRPRVSSILFARNLFLPDDLGGNRYPYETMRRLGRARPPGHRRHAAAARPFPGAAGRALSPVPVHRPHPAVSHFTNLLGATLALRGVPRHAVAIAGSYDAALGPWAGAASSRARRWCSCFTRSSTRSGCKRAALARQLLRRYMAAVERRVFSLSRAHRRRERVFRAPDPARAPGAADTRARRANRRRDRLLHATVQQGRGRAPDSAWTPTSRSSWASVGWPASSSSID